MANWAWPHTPVDTMARLVLRGGPFDGEQTFFLPRDISPPLQMVWSGWFPWGFDAWLYEWTGEREVDRGRTDAIVYRPTGRRLTPDEIPEVIGHAADVFAEAANLAMSLLGFPGV